MVLVVATKRTGKEMMLFNFWALCFPLWLGNCYETHERALFGYALRRYWWQMLGSGIDINWCTHTQTPQNPKIAKNKGNKKPSTLQKWMQTSFTNFYEFVTLNILWKKFFKMKGVLDFKFHDFLLKLSFHIFFENLVKVKWKTLIFENC